MDDNKNYFFLKTVLKKRQRYDQTKTDSLIARLPAASQSKKFQLAQEIIDNNLYFVLLNTSRFSGFIVPAYGYDILLSVYAETIINLKKALISLKKCVPFPTIIWGVSRTSRDKIIKNEVGAMRITPFTLKSPTLLNKHSFFSEVSKLDSPIIESPKDDRFLDAESFRKILQKIEKKINCFVRFEKKRLNQAFSPLQYACQNDISFSDSARKYGYNVKNFQSNVLKGFRKRAAVLFELEKKEFLKIL